jgi:sugar lactone lactonase YvrE
MVRINHLRNCVLCHAPSFWDGDKVRGFVPETGMPLPPAFSREYYAPKQQGQFVRADVTYLQQDFSVAMAVPDHGAWPRMQRFDFFVRQRPAGPADERLAAAMAGMMPEQHRAVAFALRELTGQYPGPSAEDWKRYYFRAGKAERLTNDLLSGAGVAVTPKGRVFVCDPGMNAVMKLDAEGRPAVFQTDFGDLSGLALDGKGRLIAAQKLTGLLIAIDPATSKVEKLAGRFHGPEFLAVDRSGGVYLTDPFAGGKGAVYYVSPAGDVKRLVIDVVQPRGITLSADEKTLLLTADGSSAVRAFPLESAGSPGPGRVVCNLEARSGDPVVGGNGMASDARGNVFVCHPARKAVQVINAEGAVLGLVSLPEAPLHCCVGGEDGRTLYVTSAKSVYAVKIDGAGVAVAAR